MSAGSDRGAHFGAAIAVAGGVAVGWGWNHALSGTATALLVPGSIAGAATLAWFCVPLVRGICPQRPALAMGAAAFLVFGVLPAAVSLPALRLFSGEVYAILAAAALALAACILARMGRIAVGVALATAAAWTFWSSPPVPDLLPAAPSFAAPIESPIVKRVAVIGIDSGDWRVLDPLLEAGELPHLRSLIERGASGVLRSVEPTYSPVVWASVFSGKTPDKHGITGWFDAHSANRRARMLWRMVGAAGHPSVVVNVPGTWPPRKSSGVVVSGFPIPTLLRAPALEAQQVLGHVLATEDRPGSLVPTRVLRQSGAHADGDVIVGEVQLPLRTRVRHTWIDKLDRRRLLPPRLARVPVRFDAGLTGKRGIEIAGQAAELASGEWSDWLRTRVAGHPVRFRVRALEEGGFYVTPFYQDPVDPVYRFTSDPQMLEGVLGDEMYVVESTGWRAAQDAELRTPLVEHLRDVEEQHLRTAQALAARIPDWKLFAHVITLTDRTSHAFWRFHDPDGYPPMDAAELAANRERLHDAYRFADAQLGELLAMLGDDTTIFIASDHGSAKTPGSEWGGHRLEGIWIAAGPGIRPARERREISVLDVTPTLLVALGLPWANDMDGVARLELFDTAVESREIASYETEDAVVVTQQIDSTTENQLRSLGYVE
jgi:hypothetical protein